MRKHTKFTTCQQHAPTFAGMGRYRMAEFFGEGGPAGAAPCEGAGCSIAPGADLFCASLCDASYDTRTGLFAWGCNR